MYCTSLKNITTFAEFKPLIQQSVMINNPQPKGLSITIDDGPSYHVLPMLKLFARENIKVSFFLLADKIQKNPAIVKQIANAGHDICVHGFDHQIITQMPLEQFRHSLEKFDQVAKSLNISYQKIYRPPNGEISVKQIDLLQQLGYKIVLWSLDSFDWKHNSQQIINHFKHQDDLNHITLFHDDVIDGNWFSTLKSLVLLIDLCKQKQIDILPMNLT